MGWLGGVFGGSSNKESSKNNFDSVSGYGVIEITAVYEGCGTELLVF